MNGLSHAGTPSGHRTNGMRRVFLYFYIYVLIILIYIQGDCISRKNIIIYGVVKTLQ